MPPRYVTSRNRRCRSRALPPIVGTLREHKHEELNLWITSILYICGLPLLLTCIRRHDGEVMDRLVYAAHQELIFKTVTRAKKNMTRPMHMVFCPYLCPSPWTIRQQIPIGQPTFIQSLKEEFFIRKVVTSQSVFLTSQSSSMIGTTVDGLMPWAILLPRSPKELLRLSPEVILNTEAKWVVPSHMGWSELENASFYLEGTNHGAR